MLLHDLMSGAQAPRPSPSAPVGGATFTASGGAYVAPRNSPAEDPNRPRIQLPDESAAPALPPGMAKVGRNEACPCGSGKKFKNCHGKGIV